MNSLSVLPSDILAHILHGKHYSHLVIVLWKSGDRLLQAKLAQGVTWVKLEDMRAETKSKFPHMLHSLTNLRYLSIDRYESNLGTSIMDLQVNMVKLSSLKLETLKIRCLESKALFRVGGEVKGEPSSSMLAKRYSMQWAGMHREQNKVPLSDFLPLNEIFPNLKTFKLAASYTTRTPNYVATEAVPTLFEKDFERLPSSLTKLSTSIFLSFPFSGPVFSKLPRHLNEWNTDFVYNDVRTDLIMPLPEADKFAPTHLLLSRIWSNPPPALKTFGLFLILFPQAVPTLDFLPKTLRKIQLDIDEFQWTPEHFASLPPYIEDLYLSELDHDAFDHVEGEQEGNAVGNNNHNGIGNHHHGDGNHHYGNHVFGESLKSIWTKWLPRELKSLTINNACLPDGLSIPLCFHLPRTLTSLDLYLSEDGYHFGDHSMSSSSSSCFLDAWPPHLSQLTINGCSIPSSFIAHLPRSLTDLNISVTIQEATFPSSHLPPSLSSLTLSPSITPPPHHQTLIFDSGFPSTLSSLTINLHRVDRSHFIFDQSALLLLLPPHTTVRVN